MSGREIFFLISFLIGLGLVADIVPQALRQEIAWWIPLTVGFVLVTSWRIVYLLEEMVERGRKL